MARVAPAGGRLTLTLGDVKKHFVPAKEFLADQERRQKFIDRHKTAIEAVGGYFSHWGTDRHLGIVLTVELRSGEFHVQSDGSIDFYAEHGPGETIKSRRIRVMDERGIEEQYAAFREAITNPESVARVE